VKKSCPYSVFVWLFIFAALISSCGSVNKIRYFNITRDSTARGLTSNPEAQIQKNDLLSITVSSLSSEDAKLYNMPNTVAGAGANAIPGGYLVDEAGNIQFPMLGTLKAAGLTKMQLQQDITNRLMDKKLLLDPIISIRNLNYKVTVLGEVLHPTVVNVPSEKINLLEALGFAGDLTIYANRSNVLLIREEDNRRTFKVINLNSADIFSSPYYYLKPNDIIYVEPNKAKVTNNSLAREWLPVVFSALSLVTLATYRLKGL
jgi:polysaccharide export outer membrane protein